MEYSDFYDIAVYGNENWKGSFTPKEIECNAYDYFCDFIWSQENNKLAHSMSELIKLLKEDDSEESTEWYNRLIKELHFEH